MRERETGKATSQVICHQQCEHQRCDSQISDKHTHANVCTQAAANYEKLGEISYVCVIHVSYKLTTKY